MYIKAKQNDLKVMYFRNKNIFKRQISFPKDIK